MPRLTMVTNVVDTTPEESPVAFADKMLGIKPHEKQALWLETRAPVKTACCGRRWGKSFAEAVDLVWFALAHPGTIQFLFAPTADQSRIIMEYADNLLRNGRVWKYVLPIREGSALRESPFPEIRFINGSSIHSRTAGKTGIPSRGRGADRVVLDEAAFIPEAIISNVILPYLANSPFAERVNISTPWGMNHFFEDFQRGRNNTPGYASFQFPSDTSPYVTTAYLNEQRRQMTTQQYAQEYGAEFREDQNAVFPLTLIESCRVSDIDPEPQPDHRYVIGYDPAKWSDRSGVVVLDATERPYRAVHVTDIGGRDYLVQANEIGTLAHRYNDAAVLLDATSHDQMLEQLQRDGVQADGFKFTNESKGELINGLVMAMEQGQVRIPNHADLIRELSYYRYEMTPAGNVRLGAPDKSGHYDDLVTALALAVQAGRTSAAGLLVAGRESPPDPYQPQTTSTFANRLARKRA